jgi:hypothetical protein
VPRNLTVLLATLALLLPAAALGCGGGGDDKSSGGGTLSTQDNLKIDQDRADVDEFCSVSSIGKGELYDRALFSIVSATDDLVIVYKKNTNGVYHDPVKKRNIKLRQVVEDTAKKLRGCGKDGKQQSAKLTQALQSSQ